MSRRNGLLVLGQRLLVLRESLLPLFQELALALKRGRDVRVEIKKLEDQGIILRSDTRDGVLEEIPEAYKDIDEVVNVVHNAGLARKVARLRPMGVVKG